MPSVASPLVNGASMIPLKERLIVALDVPDAHSAKNLVADLRDSVVFYKIGLELAMSGHYFELMQWLLGQGKRVFADLKFYDIPATVAAAVRQLSDSGASFLTVHGDRAIIEAAAAQKGPDMRLLAVTVLTSISEAELKQMGITMQLDVLTLLRAEQAIDAGCDGVIASGLEARKLRERLGADPLIVTPGIRSTGERASDDQKRVVTPSAAFEAGADHIVVGRPIRDAAHPFEAASAIQAEIAGFFG